MVFLYWEVEGGKSILRFEIFAPTLNNEELIHAPMARIA